MHLAILLAATNALAGDWYADFGGQFDADSHLIATVVHQTGPWQIGLYTDTLEVRVAPELDRGRAWVAVRAEAGAGGLLISPWRDGAPAPEEALLAGYFGSEGGVVRYGPSGLWVGAQVVARAWWFLPTEQTAIDVPGWTPVGTADALGGWWSDPASIEVTVGADARVETISPHVNARARWTPDWPVRPIVSAHVGWAARQDFLNTTRLGGLNPYVVPLAGAAWAEFRVEDYAAARVGVELNLDAFDVAAFADVAHFQARTEVGFGPRVRVEMGRLGFELSGGLSPTLERQQGTAASAFALIHWSSR